MRWATYEESDDYVAWLEFLIIDGAMGPADANGAFHAG